MLQPEVFKFLKGLAANNSREWFEANKDLYLQAKASAESFAAGCTAALAAAGGLKQQPEYKMFRIYRDVRFSKDKRPYKTNFGIMMGFGVPETHRAGYYLNIEPGNCFISAGVWRPEPEVLKALRQEIDYNTDEFIKLVTGPAFSSMFTLSREDALKLPPKGYDAAHPAIEYLKLKSFIVTAAVSDAALRTGDAEQFIADQMLLAQPFLQFLTHAIQE